MDRRYTLAGIVLRYLPNFCWQDINEITSMLQQEYYNINPQSIKVVIYDLVKSKEIIRKISSIVSTGPEGLARFYIKNS